MAWPVEVTAAFEPVFPPGRSDREAVNAAVDTLEDRGPGLGRPLVVQSRVRAMSFKELRIGTIRILFRFIHAERRFSCSAATRWESGVPGIKGHRCRRRSLRPLSGRPRRGSCFQGVTDLAVHKACARSARDDSSPEHRLSKRHR